MKTAIISSEEALSLQVIIDQLWVNSKELVNVTSKVEPEQEREKNSKKFWKYHEALIEAMNKLKEPATESSTEDLSSCSIEELRRMKNTYYDYIGYYQSSEEENEDIFLGVATMYERCKEVEEELRSRGVS